MYWGGVIDPEGGRSTNHILLQGRLKICDQFKFQKDAQNRNPTNSQLNVNLYAEVHKQISFANGVYRIVYL